VPYHPRGDGPVQQACGRCPTQNCRPDHPVCGIHAVRLVHIALFTVWMLFIGVYGQGHERGRAVPRR
jgi:hypothetical protein